MPRIVKLLPALWGVAGVLLLLAKGVIGLWGFAAEALRSPALGWQEAGLGAVWLCAMGYLEGYRGFQKAFAPRVAARAMSLAGARALHVALAPLYCMGLVHATRRRLASSWLLLAGIVALVASVRLVPQPYRGLIDAGVVFGLAWGAIAVVAWFSLALAGRRMPVQPDLPGEPSTHPLTPARTTPAP
ncbi:MAG: hypothetical protein HYZ28_08215 [Myxococcales bacterium]|nr:hypothetical protein [Myxococcales bacterium]